MKKFYTSTAATFTAANGETVSYQEVFESIRKNIEVYAKAGGRYLSAEDVEDLIQDTILKAIRSHGTFDPSKAKVSTWTGAIAFNAEKDALQRYRSRNYLPAGQLSEEEREEEKERALRLGRTQEADTKRTEPLFRIDRESHEEYLNPSCANLSRGGDSADREAESNEGMERIQRAIRSLNENYQFIISLHLQGMRPKDMAQLIGCTADAAATLLCRARKSLKTALGWSFLASHGIAA